jgi:hypothetical protein
VTDRFGQEATVWFELHLEENPDNPTEEEMAGAAVIRAGESVHVDVEPESRGEFFKFVPEKTCVYTLTSTFDENGTWNSLRLELYDSDYNPVAVDKEDDYFNSQTLYTFLAGEGETCYLRARSEDDFSAGSYTLSLAENAAFCAYGSDMVYLRTAPPLGGGLSRRGSVGTAGQSLGTRYRRDRRFGVQTPWR